MGRWGDMEFTGGGGTVAQTAAEGQVETWRKHCIHVVPDYVKGPLFMEYLPRLVSFGPYHHGTRHLIPMEEHKRRSLDHFLWRCQKPMPTFIEAVEGLRQQLMDAYECQEPAANGRLQLMDAHEYPEPAANRRPQLMDAYEYPEPAANRHHQRTDAYEVLKRMREWRYRPRAFLEMLVLDGCFMLEIMRAHTGDSRGYAGDDPIFGFHARFYTSPLVRRDMLLLENQLPLFLLRRLVAVENDWNLQTDEDRFNDVIRGLVLRFLRPPGRRRYSNSMLRPSPQELELHPLDVYRKSCCLGVGGPTPTSTVNPSGDQRESEEAIVDIIWPATELSEAGITFKTSSTDCFVDIDFQDNGVLSLPPLELWEYDVPRFLNLMAFEQLHAGVGDEVSAFINFMASILHTGNDVSLLHSKGIIPRIADYRAVAKVFNHVMTHGVRFKRGAHLEKLHRRLGEYCRRPWPRWRFKIVHTYFSIPGTGFSVAAAVVVLSLTVAQVVYAALQYYQGTS